MINIATYQDLLDIGKSDKERIDFVQSAIAKWKTSDTYRDGQIADAYYNSENVEICKFQKFLTKVTGERIPDLWSANFKITSDYFFRFTTQKVQFLLANGVSWTNEQTAERLGNEDYPFDSQLQELATKAAIGGVAFGFYNLDRIDVFGVSEFVPLYDEENGALMSGIRFWQIAANKPLRATLYELDGFTEMRWKDGEGTILQPKRTYKITGATAKIGGTEIYGGENYPGFPIVPLWANKRHKTDLKKSIKSKIDCYDLIYSGFADTIDEASYIYWTLNAGGMDDIDLNSFVQRLKMLHAVATDDDVTATPNSLQAPFEARDTLLNRLERDLFKDAMALDVQNISGGVATATEIRAAYEPLFAKTDDFEYCVCKFIQSILKLAGIEDKPTFTRSMLVNVSEDVQTILQAAPYLSTEYVTEKILDVFGDGDKAEEIIAQTNAERLETLTNAYKSKTTADEENGAQSGAEEE